MVFGHDLKYRIPEADRTLGFFADMGIFFDGGSESISYPYGQKYLIQTFNTKRDERGFNINLQFATHDIHKREGETI